jgi:flagellar hook-associated protein 3 FlgL
MRVTEGQIAGRFLLDINRARARIVKLSTEISTSKRVLKASDDPQAADVIIRLKNTIARSEQYDRNMTEAGDMLESTESAMNGFTDVLMSLKELVVRARSGLSSDLTSFATQVDGLLTEAVDLANTKTGGKYLFGGTNTLTQPFTLAADRSAVTANPAGITGSIAVKVADGMTQTTNIDGQEAFQGTAIFAEIIAIRDALAAGTEPTPAQVDSVSTHMNYVADKGAKSGSMLSLFQNMQANLATQQTQMASLLSDQQDADPVQATTDMKLAEAMLEAALNVTGKILPKTLVDYM